MAELCVGFQKSGKSRDPRADREVKGKGEGIEKRRKGSQDEGRGEREHEKKVTKTNEKKGGGSNQEQDTREWDRGRLHHQDLCQVLDLGTRIHSAEYEVYPSHHLIKLPFTCAFRLYCTNIVCIEQCA